jgi:monoamine oxidase
MRVVVVGAGFAGLTCAIDLRRAGVDVVVIEAGRRAGGRARTVRDRFVAGQYVESGAEWVDTDHSRMRELLDRYGMALQGAGQEWTTIRRMLFRNGALLRAEQLADLEPGLDAAIERFDDLFERIAAGIADPARPDLHPQAATQDRRAIADVLRDSDLGELATLFALRRSQGEFASEPSEISALFVAQQRAQMNANGIHGVVRAHRVEGGLAQLVHHLVDEFARLGGPPVSLGEAVERVSWSDAAANVSTTTRSLAVDRVVLACSLVPLRSVTFEPALPAPLATAIGELGYGTVTKTALQYPQRTWPDGYATTTQRSQRVYESTVDQSGEPGVLMAYTGGDGGRTLAQVDEAARMAAVAADLQVMYGLDSPLGGFSRAWSNEPRFGGSYAAYGPGQVVAHWNVLRQPCGSIHLAGEHVATWTGYLEGAVESGQRVAAAIVAETSGSATPTRPTH